MTARFSKGEGRAFRVLRSKKAWVAATVGAAAIGVFATVALGSPGSMFGIAGTETYVTANLDDSVHENSDRVKFQTKDPTYVRVQKIVIGAGGYSGWHHHPGVVIVAVQSGSVTFTKSDCSSKTYGPNSVFIEAGDDPGQASSAGGATVLATYIAPNNGPVTSTTFREEDPVVSCP
jgi:quercetin dioxygenase-like cupin family protein